MEKNIKIGDKVLVPDIYLLGEVIYQEGVWYVCEDLIISYFEKVYSRDHFTKEVVIGKCFMPEGWAWIV